MAQSSDNTPRCHHHEADDDEFFVPEDVTKTAADEDKCSEGGGVGCYHPGEDVGILDVEPAGNCAADGEARR